MTPERVAERTPLVLAPGGDATARRIDALVLGFMRICIGLRSSSAQRRQGRWAHREDWAWRLLPEAMEQMSAQALPGYLVAILELPVEVSPLAGRRGRLLLPVRSGPWEQLRWLSPDDEVPLQGLTKSPGPAYLHVQQFARKGSAGERARWRSALVERQRPD